MTDPIDLGFIHQYRAPHPPEGRHLLLLHGTGGNEEEILSLGELLAPERGRLAPRGRVREGSANRFFRRLAEGVFDQEDLLVRAAELADFVERASDHYGIDRGTLVAAGYSNGANIATAMMLLRPASIAGAVLFRPMTPFVPEAPVDLGGRPVLAIFGATDPLSPPGEVERLAGVLRDSGADVDTRTVASGHGLTRADVDLARVWLAER